jgi:hypothetical protein
LKRFLSCVALLILPAGLLAQPLYPNSVASNDLDFIRPDDPAACWSLTRTARARTEMYDPRRDILFVEGAFQFTVTFADHNMRLNVHPKTRNPAQRARQAAASVARLPGEMRRAVTYVNILDGDGAAWEDAQGGFFTLYDGLMARRLAEHDLDETVFHEAAHVALDPVLSNDPDWRANQQADGAFITRYAAENPDKEDIAETALFVWTMLYHPGRLPVGVEAAVRATIPNRLEYMGHMLVGFDPPVCAD